MNQDFKATLAERKQQQSQRTTEDKRTAAIMNAVTSTAGEQIKLAKDIKTLLKQLKGAEVTQVQKQLAPVLREFVQSLKQLEKLQVEIPNEIVIKNGSQSVVEAVQSLQTTLEAKDTTVTITPTPITVEKIDLKPLEKALKNLKQPEVSINLSELLNEVSGVEKAVRDLIERPIPVPEAPHSFKNGSSQGAQALVDSDGHAQVDILTMPAVSIDTTGLATETKQDTIIGHLDGVESSLTSISSSNTNINSDTTAILADTTNIKTAVQSKHITGIGHGVRTVTTAGTDVVLLAATACKRVTIQEQTDNTGLIAVGAVGVDAAEATGTGIILYAGDSYEFDIDNLGDVYIDSTVNGDGVRYTYFT